MTRSLVVLAATATVAALPAVAGAKEAEKAKVCGAEGCTTQTSEQDRQAVITAVENGGPPAGPPSRHAPFYRVSIYMRGAPNSEPPFRLLVVPSLRRVRADGTSWFSMDRIAYRAWRRVVHGIKPLPAAKLPLTVSKPPPGAGQLPAQTYAPALHAPATDAGGTAWGLIGAIAAGMLALVAGAMALLVRRRRREPPAPPQTAPVS